MSATPRDELVFLIEDPSVSWQERHATWLNAHGGEVLALIDAARRVTHRRTRQHWDAKRQLEEAVRPFLTTAEQPRV